VCTHHIAPIIFTEPQLIYANLFSIFISVINCQFQRFAVVQGSFLKLKELKTMFSHIHTSCYSEVKHPEPSGIVLYISVYYVQLEKGKLVVFVEIKFIADVEKQLRDFALAILDDFVGQCLLISKQTSLQYLGLLNNLLYVSDILFFPFLVEEDDELVNQKVELMTVLFRFVIHESKHREELDILLRSGGLDLCLCRRRAFA